ncbi:MAG TPA: GNAT family N-acetyltransferase [Candidatus Peribacteraceae bacterium]|nr:GNAT family N-acetyltransferase [Candidatus Peribacteraceae bacterium]
MNEIHIAKANENDFLKLVELDYQLENTKRFDVLIRNQTIFLQERDLQSPVLQKSINYTKEIKEYAHALIQSDVFALIAYCDKQPVGYIFSRKQDWPGCIVFVIEGILVANKFRGKDIAQKLVMSFVDGIKKIDGCRGFSVELDTEKYEACHLFLKMGAKFAGTKLYIYSNENPKEGTKEAIYFFYKL